MNTSCAASPAGINNRILEKLACPKTHAPLNLRDGHLATVDGKNEYAISGAGIPLFAEKLCSIDAARQRDHYQAVAEKYVENLGYPHTQEYMAYLDRMFMSHVLPGDLAEAAEICCGQGELLHLANGRLKLGVGVDISPKMLEAAKKQHGHNTDFLFLQGDATQLPLAGGQFQSVFMFGGVHHVSDRRQLFAEVYRILRPGGHFYFREPVSDFFLWRWIRAIIYRISPALDAETERPLLWKETVPVLKDAGLKLKAWYTYGFLGFCFFMNSDVLIFNRLLRFIPCIRALTRLWTHIDDLTARLPGLGRSGLQVVGVAKKPLRKDP